MTRLEYLRPMGLLTIEKKSPKGILGVILGLGRRKRKHWSESLTVLIVPTRTMSTVKLYKKR